MRATSQDQGPEAERRPGVRDRLLDAAYTGVVSGQWPRLRMADIAATAGVSRQTLYNEFGTKEGLLQAMVLRQGAAFLDRVKEILDGDACAPARTIADAVEWTLSASHDDPLLRAIITGDDALLPVLTTRSATLHTALSERMAQFLRERAPGLAADDAAAIAEVSLRLTISYLLLPGDPAEAARRVELVVRSMVTAIRSGAV
ncbi:TetR family transcriptional regulator [Murinocardiopsis flavida]|uniref:TetR family transcriptional regulator n=1 Tax=Murinocardiopsis flavida TaxID=645275 RepID=A0A2P8DJL3_9ACTN|nr:TetR family transcriptional regulator [Murinocardiopsis flavida]PSK97410.1 TetR family transcriptional regulator [Murinocardiopsis flavida]